MSDGVVGEVVVRREWLRVPIEQTWAGPWGQPLAVGSPFRYAWAERQAERLAWRTFEDEGWSEFGLDEPDDGPPVYLLAIRATPDRRYFIARYGLAGNAYDEKEGFLMAAGYVG